MSDPILAEIRADVDELINTKREAIEALINIRMETSAAVFCLNEVLHRSAGNTGDLLRKVEQHLHTVEEHLGNVLGDVPGEEEKKDG